MTTFERIVTVSPAYDKRHVEPSKNYGIGACRITFVLKGEKGAVQFMIGTNWYVPSARAHLKKFPLDRMDRQQKPEGWYVGYHAHEPQYEGQSPMGQCDLIQPGPCYYDGSSLWADELVEPFVAGGTEWLWPKLEEIYRNRFEKAAS